MTGSMRAGGNSRAFTTSCDCSMSSTRAPCKPVAALDKTGLKHALAARPDVLQYFGDAFAYRACLQWVLLRTWERLEREGFKDIAFFHETNQYASIATDVFVDVQKRFPNSAANFTMADKCKWVPLQCADILAYEGNHQMRDTSKARKPLDAIDPTRTRISYVYLREGALGELADILIELA